MSERETPATEGLTLGRARMYDLSVEAAYFGRGRRYRERVLDLASVNRGDRTLDVGCGPGRLVLAAARRVGPSGEAHGIDASPDMIAYSGGRAKKLGSGAKFTTAVAEDLPFEDGYFDAITSSLVIHHLPGDELKQKVFAEMRRVLKPDGRVLIVDFVVPESGPIRPVARLLADHMGPSAIDDYPAMMEAASLAVTDRGEAAFKVLHYMLATAG